jgi:hypothetical protein
VVLKLGKRRCAAGCSQRRLPFRFANERSARYRAGAACRARSRQVQSANDVRHAQFLCDSTRRSLCCTPKRRKFAVSGGISMD